MTLKSVESTPLDESALEKLSPAEAAFEKIRKKLGFVLAPLVFCAVFFGNFPSLNTKAHHLAAIMATTAVLWVCESLPMTVTALLAAVGCIALRVGTPTEVFSPFATSITFLFIGSFMLARAVFIHGLDRRFAYGILSLPWIGARPGRILFGFGAATAFMSAWISNTATTAMMFAIGMSILAVFFRQESGPAQSGAGATKIDRRFATGLMLMTSFAASIGGLATPIGTPPNLIGINAIRMKLGVEFSFFQWSMLGFPVVIVLFLFLFAYLNFFCPAGVREIQGGAELLRERRRSLGRWTTSQKSTIAAFLVTVVLWILPGVFLLIEGKDGRIYEAIKDPLNEGVVALIGAILLFLLPGDREGRAIDWKNASQIDWGIVLLYGGGFALGALADTTGLAKALGEGLCQLFPMSSSLAMLIFATVIATLVSEATSNTASAQIIVPVVIQLAIAAKMDPLEPALGATFGASLGFMLPVSTPCNAIVYGSGYVPLTRMIRYGILLDLIGIVVVVVMLRFLLPILL
ncbi:MAG: DASS family sodium-coupled anion symporter [Planctomycetia bacterium]|nr:DASS family sodium-coupled anion symporter [Planctomycetia bacterium]